jgi:hypothetical protein
VIRHLSVDRISIDGVLGINRSRMEIALRTEFAEIAAPTGNLRPARTTEERLARQIADQVREAIRES